MNRYDVIGTVLGSILGFGVPFIVTGCVEGPKGVVVENIDRSLLKLCLNRFENNDHAWVKIKEFATNERDELCINTTRVGLSIEDHTMIFHHVLTYMENGEFKIIVPAALRNHQWKDRARGSLFGIKAVHYSKMEHEGLVRALKEGITPKEIISLESEPTS